MQVVVFSVVIDELIKTKSALREIILVARWNVFVLLCSNFAGMFVFYIFKRPNFMQIDNMSVINYSPELNVPLPSAQDKSCPIDVVFAIVNDKW